MNNRGIALIQVLLITAILSILAMYLTITAQDQVKIARWSEDKAEALVLLHNAESNLLFNLLTEEKKHPAENISHEDKIIKNWNFYGEKFKIGESISVSIQDQAGLLHAYKPDHEIFSQALIGYGIDEADSEKILANLVDWQDVDNVSALAGVENKGFFGGPRNGKVSNLYEFLYINGISKDIFNFLKNMLSLHKQASFNPMVAPKIILSAFLSSNGISDSKSSEIIELRAEGLLTKAMFIEITGIKEDDEKEILFHITSILNIRMESQIGNSKVTKEMIIHINPYASNGLRPLNYFLNRG